MKDISVIPKGIYCHSTDGKFTICPYWSTKENLPEQENGYCSYLEQSDFDINEELDKKYGGMKIIYAKDAPELAGAELKISAHDGIGSLLFDKCKECKINEEEEDTK